MLRQSGIAATRCTGTLRPALPGAGWSGCGTQGTGWGQRVWRRTTPTRYARLRLFAVARRPHPFALRNGQHGASLVAVQRAVLWMAARMVAADFFVQEGVDPAHSLAADRHFLHAVRRASRVRRAVLRVYSFRGECVSLGRYHLAPPAAAGQAAGGVQLWRRHSGGRAVPFGDGFVGVSLVLPHRSALFAEDPLALAPHQVINRYVRGILESCKLVRIPAFYPGRDFITVDRRVLGLVSFETDEAGALLFEAILANTRDFGILAELIDRADPEGTVKVDLPPPDSTTSLQRELRARLSLEELADLLRRGFARQFGLTCEQRPLRPLEVRAIEAIAAREFSPPAWLLQRRPRPDLTHRGVVFVQLGAFEVHFSVEQQRFIKDIMFAGDFLANAASIDRLERQLRLCPAEWRAIDAVASEIYSDPHNYILGIGKLRTVADVIVRALGS